MMTIEQARAFLAVQVELGGGYNRNSVHTSKHNSEAHRAGGFQD